MTCTLYPDAPGMQSMPQLWRSLRSHWSRPSHEPDQAWNDDLVGFLHAVPRQDILRAVIALTKQFLEQSGCTILSVDLLSKSGHQGKPRGRTRSSFKRCWVEDIPLIVQASFSTGTVTAAGKCRLRKEGTCIGKQISPALSRLPVLMAEQTDIFEVTPSCSFLATIVPEICGQPPEIGTVSYLSEPTDSRLPSPCFFTKGYSLNL